MSITTNKRCESSSLSNRTEKNMPSLRFAEFNESLESLKLGDVAKFSKGKGISKADISENGKTPCVRYGELYTHYNEVINETLSFTNVDINDLVLSKKNDVIIPASGETAIDIATASCVTKDNIALSGDLNIIKSPLNGIFLSYYLNNKKKTDIASLAQGISVSHIYASQLSTLKLNIPRLPEQQKIASFLSSVDSKISLLQEKHSQLQQYKKGVMQQLFSQKLRFTQADGSAYPDWAEKNIGFYIEEYTEKTTTQNEYEVLTSSKSGLVSQEDYFENSRISNRENIGFNIIPEGFMTYRTRSDDRKFFFNENNLGKTGIISTYYPVFKIKNGSNNFFIHLFLYHQGYIGKYSVGTSQTVLSLNELRKIKLPIPDFKEQQKIAECLMAIDAKIDAVADQLASVQAFKKGLLQKMFV